LKEAPELDIRIKKCEELRMTLCFLLGQPDECQCPSPRLRTQKKED
jgi:hypothetical protein